MEWAKKIISLLNLTPSAADAPRRLPEYFSPLMVPWELPLSTGCKGTPLVNRDEVNYFIWFAFVADDHEDNDGAEVVLIAEKYSIDQDAPVGSWHLVEE